MINGGHSIPILGKKNERKAQEEEKIRLMMQQPAMAEKVAQMASELAKNFNASTRIITDIRAGATFLDTLTKTTYAYEYISQPFHHDLRTKVVMEEAKLPLEEFDPGSMYMLIYDVNSNPTPRYIINAVDFCKYFAIGVWELQDGNNAEEKAFLKSVG